MCGIAGALYFQSRYFNQELVKEKLCLALTKMKSRGPDGNSYFLHQEYGLAIGHNRLKIQDLSELSNQPFYSFDRSVVVSFNGQLYNHWQLREELSALFGYRFITTSDTETLVAAYQCWGLEKALEKFQGMFAFALYDFAIQKLFLVRDRFGIKPLYFFKTQDAIFFASQLDGLLLFSDSEPVVSQLSLYHYLHLLSVPAPLTIFQGFYKLAAGYLLEIDSCGEMLIHRWYNLLYRVNALNGPENYDIAKAGLDDLLHSSVKSHVLASDVPVAVFLSGGIDSSLLTTLAARYRNVTAFHLRFSSYDFFTETIAATSVAEKLGINFQALTVNEESFSKSREAFMSRVDDLVADPVCISFYALSEFVSQHGFKVAIVGEGADELCWGYDLYFKHASLDYYGKFLSWLPLIPKFIASQCYSGYREESFNRVANGQSSFLSGALGFFSSQLKYVKKMALLEKNVMLDQLAIVDKFWHLANDSDPFDISTWYQKEKKSVKMPSDFWFSYQEFLHRLPELLLMRCDKVAMLFGLETRVPFLDHRVVEYILNLPLNYKTHANQPKGILKSLAEKYLESKIVWQKKQGFSAPFLTEQSTSIQPAIKISSARRPNNLQQWCLNLFLSRCYSKGINS